MSEIGRQIMQSNVKNQPDKITNGMELNQIKWGLKLWNETCTNDVIKIIRLANKLYGENVTLN